MATEFMLPELGENIETIQVAKIMVAVGDTIAEDQPLLELETDKATIEVPSSVAGTVSAIHVSEGDETQVGALVLTLGEGAAPPAPAAATAWNTWWNTISSALSRIGLCKENLSWGFVSDCRRCLIPARNLPACPAWVCFPDP